MFYLIGLAIFLFSVASSFLLLNGNSWDFIDLATFILIVIPLAGILTATQNWKVFGIGFKAVILPKTTISDDMRGKAASLFRFLSKSTAFIVVIHTLVFIIVMALGIDWQEPETIGRIGGSIAAATIMPLYGLILIAAVFEPIVIILKKRGDKDRK